MSTQLEKELLSKIERLELLEERFQIRFEALNVVVDEDGWVTVNFELLSNSGAEIKESILVNLVFYKKEGGIIYSDDRLVSNNDFFGIAVFKFNFQEDGAAHDIGKIRLFPTKR